MLGFDIVGQDLFRFRKRKRQTKRFTTESLQTLPSSTGQNDLHTSLQTAGTSILDGPPEPLYVDSMFGLMPMIIS